MTSAAAANTAVARGGSVAQAISGLTEYKVARTRWGLRPVAISATNTSTNHRAASAQLGTRLPSLTLRAWHEIAVVTVSTGPRWATRYPDGRSSAGGAP